jgi:acetylornithine deacetylase
MSALVRACTQLDVRLGGAVVAAYTVDEEESATGIKQFASVPDSWLASRGFLSGPRDGEGMLMDVSGVALDGSYGWVPVVGHRGAVQIAITTRGRAAHAATPDLGVNAVTAMARIIAALDDGAKEVAARAGQALDPSLLGPLTMAVGTTIAGGGVRAVRMEGVPIVDRSGINAIPDWCEATIDIRFPQGIHYPSDIRERKEGVVTAVREYIDSHVDRRGWSYEIAELNSVPPVAMAPSIEQAAALPLIQQERRRASQVLGFEPDLETAPGGTDATFMIHEARIPTIVELGPAGGLSHDVHEFVEVDSVIAGGKILALLAIDRLGLAD